MDPTDSLPQECWNHAAAKVSSGSNDAGGDQSASAGSGSCQEVAPGTSVDMDGNFMFL